MPAKAASKPKVVVRSSKGSGKFTKVIATVSVAWEGSAEDLADQIEQLILDDTYGYKGSSHGEYKISATKVSDAEFETALA